MDTLRKYRTAIVWKYLLLLTVFHILGLQALYYIVTFNLRWQSFVWFLLLVFLTGQGATSGAHRLWSHRTYKAKLPLRLFLGFFQTMSLQFTIYSWARNHRIHHKYSDTDGDPHNASRGFFYSHIGWLLVPPHPDFVQKCETVKDTDLWEDPVVYYQYKYYKVLSLICCFIIPTTVPWYFWSEDLYTAFITASILRFLVVMHCVFSINSAAHMWGTRPYDKSIKPSQNLFVSMIIQGEGWHNYHHAFPWDYKAEELGGYLGNWSTAFIDFMAKIGWAYDLKTASQKIVEARMTKTG